MTGDGAPMDRAEAEEYLIGMVFVAPAKAYQIMKDKSGEMVIGAARKMIWDIAWDSLRCHKDRTINPVVVAQIASIFDHQPDRAPDYFGYIVQMMSAYWLGGRSLNEALQACSLEPPHDRPH